MECSTKSPDCKRPAEFIHSWPGQPGAVCGSCLRWLREIAGAMGFQLMAVPLPGAEKLTAEVVEDT